MEAKKAKSSTPDPLDPAVVLTLGDLDAIGLSLRRRITDRETLLLAISDAAAVNLEGIPITLEPKLLTRLKSRCLDKENFARWLREVVVRQLHDYAGW